MSIQSPSPVIEAGTLLQHVSRAAYRGSPLYFGSDGTNRYNESARDDIKRGSARYYLGN